MRRNARAAAYRKHLELKQRCETLESELEKSKKEKKNETSNTSTATLKAGILRALKKIPSPETDGGTLNIASVCLAKPIDVKTLRGVCGGIFKEQSLDVLAVACASLLLVFCSEQSVEKHVTADRILKHLLAQCGGRGGGKETFATGSAEDASRLATLLKQAGTFAIG